MTLIKHGGEQTQWRFERRQGDRYVSAGALTCSDADARAMVQSLATKHGAAKGSNGATSFEAESKQRKVYG